MTEILTCGKKLQPNSNLYQIKIQQSRSEISCGLCGGVHLTIRQEDCRWELLPHLSISEGRRLLEFLKALGIEFDLDLNHGWPIDADIINAAVEELIDSGLVREVAA